MNRKWRGDYQDGEVKQGRKYQYRKPPLVRTVKDISMTEPESVPILTQSEQDIINGKYPITNRR